MVKHREHSDSVTVFVDKRDCSVITNVWWSSNKRIVLKAPVLGKSA